VLENYIYKSYLEILPNNLTILDKTKISNIHVLIRSKYIHVLMIITYVILTRGSLAVLSTALVDSMWSFLLDNSSLETLDWIPICSHTNCDACTLSCIVIA